MVKIITTVLNLSLYIFFLSFFFDVATEKFPQITVYSGSTLFATKVVGFVSILVTILIVQFIVYLFAIGLGGQLSSAKNYFAFALNGIIIFNIYYAIIFFFFEDVLHENLYSNQNHMIFIVGNLTYVLYVLWLVVVVRHTTNINFMKSTLAVLIPSVIAYLFKISF